MVINHRKPLRLPQSWQNNCLRIGFHSLGSKAWWTVNWTAFTHLRKKTVSLVSFGATFWIKLQRFGEVSGCENTSTQALNDESAKGLITFWKKQSHRSLGCFTVFPPHLCRAPPARWNPCQWDAIQLRPKEKKKSIHMKAGPLFFVQNQILLKNTGELNRIISFIPRTDVYGGSILISRTCAEQGPWEVLCSSSIKPMPFLLVAVKLIKMPIFLNNGRIQGAARLPATLKAKPLDLIVAGAKLANKNKIPTTTEDLSF